MKDDAQGMPHAGTDPTHTVAQVHAVMALRSLDRAVVDREGHAIALAQRHDFRTTLHARPLFGQHELATREVLAWLGEKYGYLNRECEVTIEVLVQAVEVAGNILQQQRRWTRLTGIVTSLKKRCVVVGIALGKSHPAIPLIGDRRKRGVQCGSHFSDDIGKRIFEV